MVSFPCLPHNAFFSRSVFLFERSVQFSCWPAWTAPIFSDSVSFEDVIYGYEKFSFLFDAFAVRDLIDECHFLPSMPCVPSISFFKQNRPLPPPSFLVFLTSPFPFFRDDRPPPPIKNEITLTPISTDLNFFLSRTCVPLQVFVKRNFFPVSTQPFCLFTKVHTPVCIPYNSRGPLPALDSFPRSLCYKS